MRFDSWACMNELCNMEKKDAARVLYLEGFSGKEIAGSLRLRENTISKWQKEEGWKQQKNSQSIMKENSGQRILNLIDYQTEALEKIVTKYRKEGSTKLIERGDIDALQKLFTTIKKDSRKWGDYVTVMREFLSYLEGNDLNLAKEILEIMDDFLNQKRRSL